VEARFSALVQPGPGAHPASYAMGTRSFPGIMRPGRGVDQPLPSSTEVKERVQLCLLPLWVLETCSEMNSTFIFTLTLKEGEYVQ
jgi:hypothetical protein